ncbi:ABC transporter ATP-binding protein [Paenarthrobacter sp. CCNWLY172]|uniref:ATP-binding cassette domain-containing protein n=1 Tax=unclassified Paenarthrobacter TaxID=2634190 RepID=UPI003077B9F2
MAHTDDLRRWAKGMYGLEAATELLIRAFNGKFAAPGAPWVYPSATTPEGHAQVAYIDFESIPDQAEGLSGGERRFLLLAASLAGEVHVVLGDVVSGLDRQNLELVLAAIAHAGGSHEHSGMTLHEDGTPKAFTHLTTLYPWP